METHDRIVTDPGIRSGKPRVRGTRITVQDVLKMFAAGLSIEQVMEDFDELTREDVKACFEFAALSDFRGEAEAREVTAGR